MRRFASRDMATGLLIFAFGLATAIYAQAHYKLGSFRSPGPGLFPTLVASVLTIVGVALIAQAILRPSEEEQPSFEARPFLFVVLAIAAFAVLQPYFGFAPSVLALAFIGAFADDRLKIPQKLLLAAALSGVAILLFRVVLGVRLSMFGMLGG